MGRVRVVTNSTGAREQPRRETPPARLPTRTPDVRFSWPQTHASISIQLRPDPLALYVAQTPDERLASSNRTQGALRGMATLESGRKQSTPIDWDAHRL
jgi:hypothetical protein